MFFFNLSLAEFLALFSIASAVVVALYLLDRSRRKVLAPTLRFWTQAERPVESTRRRRIRQWPSLLLQLASIACLLAAVAQLRIGARDRTSRDHVLVVDTSSWMKARAAGSTAPLIEQTRRLALRYLDALPPTDRVMVVRADALATPLTAFESDRRKLREALRRIQPGEGALDLEQALGFARRAQQRGAVRRGEIVFAGAGRAMRSGAAPIQAPENLRVLTPTEAPENAGIRKIGLRRDNVDSELWHVFVGVRNYAARPQKVDVGLQFGGAPSGTQSLLIAAGAETETTFRIRTRAAGVLEARLRAQFDGFAEDNRAVLEVPAQPLVKVAVCSDEPASLQPLLDAHPGLEPTIRAWRDCLDAPPATEGVAVYDRGVPKQPAANALYLDPPAARSPVRVVSRASNTGLERWNMEHPLTAGLGRLDVRLASTAVLAPASGDQPIAETSSGPVIVARTQGGRSVIFGFHPMKSAMRFELAAPLLFANALRWMGNDSFGGGELIASAVGTVNVPLEGTPDPSSIRVETTDGVELPFSVEAGRLRFFSGKPGTIRVRSGGKEQTYSLTLPAIPDEVWQAPAGARRGVPLPQEAASSSRDIWQWLAAAGALGLLVEWLLFSPRGTRALATVRPPASGAAESLRRAS